MTEAVSLDGWYSLVEFEPDMSYINLNADLKTACGRFINAAKELGPSQQKAAGGFLMG